MYSRRQLIVMLAAAAPIAAGGAALAASPASKAPAAKARAKTSAKPKAKAKTRTPVTTDDVSLGKDTAPITVIEYASVACPVCAKFNNEVFADFRKKYVDTGQVKYVSREILAHIPVLAAAGFLLARCAGKDQYFTVTDAIYHARDDMERTGQYMDGLKAIGRTVGMTDDETEACINDHDALVAMDQRIQTYAAKDGIQFTPTFIINGKKVAEGFVTLSDLDGFIAAAKAALPGRG